jgi:hypothetical protein
LEEVMSNVEHLKEKMDKLELLAERERASCLRTLAGVRPGGRRFAERLRRLAAATRATVVVEVISGPAEDPIVRKDRQRFSRMGYAGHATYEAIKARLEYETAVAASGA